MHRISLLNYSLHHIQPGVLWERGGGVFFADIPHFQLRPPSLRLSPLCHQLSCHISEPFQYFFFFWPKLLFSLNPKPFFLPSQQKRDETLSIRLHLLLLRKQNPLEMKHLVKCFKPHSNNSLPQRDFSSLSTLSLRGHAGTDASLRLCKIHSGKQILTTRCVCALRRWAWPLNQARRWLHPFETHLFLLQTKCQF